MTYVLIIKQLNASQSDNELIGFFSGVVFGVGIVIFFQAMIRKKTDRIL